MTLRYQERVQADNAFLPANGILLKSFELAQVGVIMVLHEKEFYSRRLVSMGYVLINFTRLDCVVSEVPYSGAPYTAATPLFKFLCEASKLENVILAFERLHSL
jgi:hypothetical protein